jgi:hypothetical protein
MTIGKGKRPRDPNQLAKWIVDQSTSENPVSEQEAQPQAPPVDPAALSQYMSNIGRKGGQIGGKRRLKTMTVEQRKRVAKKAARARWRKSKDN